MKISCKVILLWSLPLVVIVFFFWQGLFTPNVNSSPINTANTRMTYGRFLEYLNSDRLLSVDLFDGGRTAIVQANDPEIANRVIRARVDLPESSPDLIARLRDAKISFDTHPMRNDGQLWGFLGNLIFPVLLLASLFFLFRRSNNIPGGPGQAMNFGKSRARFQMEAKTGIKFDDVAGIDEAKEELQEVRAEGLEGLEPGDDKFGGQVASRDHRMLIASRLHEPRGRHDRDNARNAGI